MNAKYDEMIKIMLVGDSNVGKTSIMHAFCHPNQHQFKNVKGTVGLDYAQRIANIKGRNVLVQIWDTAGQERFQTLIPSYYRSAMGILLVFSVTDKSSFNSIEIWMRQINQYSKGIPVVMLCNKIDINSREVSDSQCKALQKHHGVKTINTSVINNHNIADAVSTLYEKISQQQKSLYRNSNTLTIMKKQGNTSKCQC